MRTSTPWRALERERGAKHSAGEDDSGNRRAGLGGPGALPGRPSGGAFGDWAASNALGTINDIARAAAMAHEAGALSFVDAVHYAPHTLVDVQKLGCDFLACSAYKFMGRTWDFVRPAGLPREPRTAEARAGAGYGPERFETGTQNHEGSSERGRRWPFLRRSRLKLVTDSRCHAGRGWRQFMRACNERGSALLQRLVAGPAGVKGLTLYGPPRRQPGRRRFRSLWQIVKLTRSVAGWRAGGCSPRTGIFMRRRWCDGWG